MLERQPDTLLQSEQSGNFETVGHGLRSRIDRAISDGLFADEKNWTAHIGDARRRAIAVGQKIGASPD